MYSYFILECKVEGRERERERNEMVDVCLYSLQDFSSLSRYVGEQQGVPFLNYVSDFHLLYFLYTASPAGIDFKVS